MNKLFDARICTKCDTPHVENCPNCFGYGVYKNRNVPIAAGEVDEIVQRSLSDIIHDAIVNKIEAPLQLTGETMVDSKYFEPCPICGGTPFNVDIFVLYGDPSEQKPIGILKA